MLRDCPAKITRHGVVPDSVLARPCDGTSAPFACEQDGDHVSRRRDVDIVQIPNEEAVRYLSTACALTCRVDDVGPNFV